MAERPKYPQRITSTGVTLSLVPSLEGVRTWEEPSKKRRYEERIPHNFLLAHQFAHGNYELRNLLLVTASSYYEDAALRNEFGTLVNAHQRIIPLITEMSKNFSNTDNDNIQREFLDGWQTQQHILEELFLPPAWIHRDGLINEFLDKPKEVQIIDILNRMTTVDLEIYGNGGRDPQTGEPFEGWVKQYIIDGQPTGSEEFDALFQSFYSMAISALTDEPTTDADPYFFRNFGTLAAQMKNVQKQWEATHPRESFYPKPYPNLTVVA